MKKYIVGLTMLFVAHNSGAMDLDPFDRCFVYDEKCRLVAKYLHKYPTGRNVWESSRIKHFLKDEISERVTILPWLVRKYKNILDNIEGEKYLCSMHRELPSDVKEKILTQALYFPAREYYVTHNTLKFLAIEQPKYSSLRYSSSLIGDFYAPYFLSEINEEDDSITFDNGGYNHNDMPKYMTIQSKAHRPKGIFIKEVPYSCNKKNMQELIFFLDARNVRVDAFKIMLNDYIIDLSQMNEEKGVDRFIELLKLFNDLTKLIIFQYTGKARLV